MKKLDLKYVCSVIGGLAGVPIRYFEKGKMQFYYDTVSLPKDPFCAYAADVLAVKRNVGYYVTPQFNYYGIVNSRGRQVVIGPARQVFNTDAELKELAFICDVAAEDTDRFLQAMKGIIPMPLDSILQILCTLNYVLNDEKLTLKEIILYDNEQYDATQVEDQRLRQAYEQQTLQQSSDLHNTLATEQAVMSIVENGDSTALRKWSEKAPAVRGGIVAGNQLRQIKNIFIVSTTLTARAAIKGGIATEDALSLSDAYIQKCEQLTTMDAITRLQYNMITDYTTRVEKVRMGKNPSKLVLDVTNYIQHHLSDAITAEQLARALYISRPYLCSKFKQETGKTLTEFIHGKKTEEAKRLLRYTDKPLIAISSYLGFSSQSHFCRIFKSLVGVSPSQYRISEQLSTAAY